MTTDTNLSQIVFNRLSNEKYHELKTSGQLNDQQFYITPDLDTNPGLIQDYMSNCITKIPQHINLELFTDGTLTLKAGSIVYVPNGFEEDGLTKKFEKLTIQNDISLNTFGNASAQTFLCAKATAFSLAIDTFSGDSKPSIASIWYDTENNVINTLDSTLNIIDTNISLPIAIINRVNGMFTSIDQVFNGMGYIGAVAFAVPGVQAIIPNGFNKDSKLNNYTVTVERVLLKDYAADNILGQNLPLTLTNSPLLSAGDMYYVEEENQMYKGSIAELNKRTEIEIAKVITDSTRITSLTPLPIYNRILGSYQTNTSGNVIGNHIGQIGYTTRTDVPEGCSWCDGAEYTQAQFPDVYQMLVDGKLQKTDYETFNSSVSTNGSCGMFALDTATTSFKVPLLKDVYIKAGQTPLAFGAESLPNIKGEGGFDPGGDTTKNNGAIYPKRRTTADGDYWTFPGTNKGDFTKFGFDASRSSEAYQDNAKVNPDHVVYRAYVVLYASAVEASVAQVQEFMTALNGKANTDLSNINTTAKNTIAGLGMPSDKYIDLDLQASGTEYEAPANGYYFLYMGVTSNGQYIGLFNIKNLGGGTGDENFNYGVLSSDFSGINPMVMLPVKKGDIVKVWYSAPTKRIFRFIYAEGSKE